MGRAEWDNSHPWHPHPAHRGGVCAQGRFGVGSRSIFPLLWFPMGCQDREFCHSLCPIALPFQTGGEAPPSNARVMSMRLRPPQHGLAPHKSFPSPSLPCFCASGRDPRGAFSKNREEASPAQLAEKEGLGVGYQTSQVSVGSTQEIHEAALKPDPKAFNYSTAQVLGDIDPKSVPRAARPPRGQQGFCTYRCSCFPGMSWGPRSSRFSLD